MTRKDNQRAKRVKKNTQSRIERLREILAMCSWTDKKASLILFGVDPEKQDGGDTKGWGHDWLPDGNKDREPMRQIWAGDQKDDKVLAVLRHNLEIDGLRFFGTPNEWLLLALKHYHIPPWLQTALEDPKCLKLLSLEVVRGHHVGQQYSDQRSQIISKYIRDKAIGSRSASPAVRTMATIRAKIIQHLRINYDLYSQCNIKTYAGELFVKLENKDGKRAVSEASIQNVIMEVRDAFDKKTSNS